MEHVGAKMFLDTSKVYIFCPSNEMGSSPAPFLASPKLYLAVVSNSPVPTARKCKSSDVKFKCFFFDIIVFISFGIELLLNRVDLN